MSISNFMPLFPELILTLGLLGLIIFGSWRGKEAVDVVNGLVLAFIAAAITLCWVITPVGMTGSMISGFALDELSAFAKVVILIGGFVALILSIDYLSRARILGFEYALLILFALLGMMVMVSATSFLTLYLGMELQSLALYVMAGYHRRSSLSSEAALKYFVLGAIATGLFLFGVSFIYGAVGQVGFAEVAGHLGSIDMEHKGASYYFIVLGIVFVLAALAFKVSAVPFHMWTPDVYQGAPTPVTAFFASAPKVAALVVFLRLTRDVFVDASAIWVQVLIFISLASMIWGAFAALMQKHIKRLLAYSSIGHMGYALIGLVALSEGGQVAMLTYAVLYMLTTLGVFALVMGLRHEGGECDKISDLAGLSHSQPFVAYMMAILMLSLAGIPPLGGFFIKYMVFKAAVSSDLIIIAVIGMLTTVVAAYYYLRVIKVMFFDEGAFRFIPVGKEIQIISLLIILLLIFFWWAPGDWLITHIGSLINA